MIEKIIQFSIRKKVVVSVIVFILIATGIYSSYKLSVDALPDITTNQVQVITLSPNLAAQEVEKYISYPIEQSVANIPQAIEVRSISRFGLSVVTIVFEDNADIFRARQLTEEKIKEAEETIPKQFGSPEMAPITTGLGEIYQYVIHPKKGYEDKYTAMELREIQDWIVKKQMTGVKGVVEVSSLGGLLKQYEVAVNPDKLRSMNITIDEVFESIEKNNANTGASYIEKGPNVYFVRTEGLVKKQNDIENIIVKQENGIPVLIRDIARVEFGNAVRYGALTRNGQGEVVGGQVLMLKGENSREVIENVKQRMEQIKKSLPEGVEIEPFIDRSKLVNNTLNTVKNNLLEGALIVIFILVLLLGNMRAGLIVASVIPLSMLFAIICMNIFGVTANLMSMGALDFGLIVDGAVIIVESVLARLHSDYGGKTLTKNEMDSEVYKSSSSIMKSASFGVIIIMIVYIPILTLSGIEGKMFKPMAQTVVFALLGALLLSLTYVPMMSALFLKREIKTNETIADRIMKFLQKIYEPALNWVLNFRYITLFASIIVLAAVAFLFTKLGGEFIPQLSEGDIATHMILKQGSSLSQSVKTSSQIEKIIKDKFPEVEQVVNKIGSPEIPTDPMPIEVGDIMIILKDRSEWESNETQEQLTNRIMDSLSILPGVGYEFTQPIQMRFNELIAGSRSDIVVKIFGEDLDKLFSIGNKAASLMSGIEGIGDLKVDRIVGLPQIKVEFDRQKIAQYGLNIDNLNKSVNSALAGGIAGTVYEDERRFDLVVRFEDEYRHDLENIRNLSVALSDGSQIPISQIAEVSFKPGPSQINREDAKRFIKININARGRDIESVVKDIKEKLDEGLKLPPGYFIRYGGQFQNLEEAKGRLSWAVPVSLFLILLILFFTFNSVIESVMIFTAVPFAAIGGVLSLWILNMNFSISAGVGFIALFGVAVLNGIVLIAQLNKLRKEGMDNVRERIFSATKSRLRPVIATAAVASFGFLPMAISKGVGAEVQKPLASVVIGGLISSTILTLLVLPVLYSIIFERKRFSKIAPVTVLLILFLLPSLSSAQQKNEMKLNLDEAIAIALKNNPGLKSNQLELKEQELLQGTSFTLDPTEFSGTFGQFNSASFDRLLEFDQSFSLPAIYSAQSELNKQRVAIAKDNLKISQNELIKNVSLSYYSLLNAFMIKELYVQLDSIYSDYSFFASRKFDAGETSLLEKTNAHAASQNLRVLVTKAEYDCKLKTIEMKKFLNIQDEIVPDMNNDIKLGLPQYDSLKLISNPYLKYRMSQVGLAESELNLQSKQWLPTFSLGYFNTTIDGETGFNGFKVGINFPILKSGTGQRKDAAKVNVEAAKSELENFRILLQSELNEIRQNIEKSKLSMDYFESQGLPLAEQILSTAQTSYRQGEIGYMEFIQNIEQAFEIKKEYLESLLEYNQSVIKLNSLLSN